MSLGVAASMFTLRESEKTKTARLWRISPEASLRLLRVTKVVLYKNVRIFWKGLLMSLEELREAATKAYVEYGEVIKKAFNLEGDLLAGPLIKTLETTDEEKMKSFIGEVKEKTRRLEEMCRRFSS